MIQRLNSGDKMRRTVRLKETASEVTLSVPDVIAIRLPLSNEDEIPDPIRKPIQVKDETIIVFPKSSGPPLREVISQTINAGDRILEGRESPNPADMRDGRIVDYTLNKRLFPVPLFPNHQKLPTNDDIRYARISVPVKNPSLISGPVNQSY